jgi:hypothetical protein
MNRGDRREPIFLDDQDRRTARAACDYVHLNPLRGEGPPMVTLAIGEEMLLLRELERGHGLSGANL